MSWEIVDAVARIAGNFILSIPILIGGWFWIRIGIAEGLDFQKYLGYMGIALSFYNFISGSIYLYTAITGTFEVFGIPVGVIYSIPNLITNIPSALFYASSLGWPGVKRISIGEKK